MKNVMSILCFAVMLMACVPQATTDPICSVHVRKAMDHPSMLTLGGEIESVEYIPLEVTENPASLLDGVSAFAVTSNHIYVVPVKEHRVVLFDRKGHFLKTVVAFGQAPGEISDMLTNIQVDEKRDRLYLFSANRVMVYTLAGEWLQDFHHDHASVFQHWTEDDRLLSVAFPYQPFQQGSYGIGVFTPEGDRQVAKYDFASPLVAPEKAGLTIGMAMGYSEHQQALLVKLGCNDTLFALASAGVQPACILQLDNSKEESIRALDATNFESLRQPFGAPQDICITDLFETSLHYYLRCYYQAGCYVVSVNKQTGKVLAEQCVCPGSIRQLSDANLLLGMLGTRSYGGFPVWGTMMGGKLVQMLTSYELDLYRQCAEVTVPDALKEVAPDDNPALVLYTLKENHP